MPAKGTKCKIFVDGGDPAETGRMKQLLGFVDGQTTNPSLIAKNPEILKRIASGRPLSRQEENDLPGQFPSTIVRYWMASRSSSCSFFHCDYP